jgi:hypothetical protein
MVMSYHFDDIWCSRRACSLAARHKGALPESSSFEFIEIKLHQPFSIMRIANHRAMTRLIFVGEVVWL